MIDRRKSRYVLVEASRPIEMGADDLQRGLAEGISTAIGESGYMNASPKVVSVKNDRVFIIRVNRGHEEALVLALSLSKELGGRQTGFYTIRLSGSIRKLELLARTLYPNA